MVIPKCWLPVQLLGGLKEKAEITNLFSTHPVRGLKLLSESCARNYRPSIRENKPKTLVFSRKRAFWTCFREYWVYKLGHCFHYLKKKKLFPNKAIMLRCTKNPGNLYATWSIQTRLYKFFGNTPNNQGTCRVIWKGLWWKADYYRLLGKGVLHCCFNNEGYYVKSVLQPDSMP